MDYGTLKRHLLSHRGVRLRSATLAAFGTVATLTLALSACGIDHTSATRAGGAVPSKAAAGRTHMTSSMATRGGAVLANAGTFVGTWHVHTIRLVIGSDGTGTASWPTHIWCDGGFTDPRTPCDRLVPVSGGEQIVDGGWAQLHLTAVAGSTAEATVGGSTDPSLLPDGGVKLTVAPTDVLTISSGAQPLALCGTSASNLTVQQQDAEGINCGA